MSRNANYIDGAWVSGSAAPFSSTDPYDGTCCWQGKAASPQDVSTAVAAARQALPDWAAQSSQQRRVILERFAEELQARQETLAATIAQEVGKPLWESRGEVAAMVGKVSVSQQAFDDRCGERHQEAQGVRSATRFKPHGVVGVFGPFNFPGHLPNGHIVPALLAGNTVVFKPSELAPAVAEQVVEAWEAVGLPAGVLNLVQGGRETGMALADHPGLDGLFFTGSCQVGQHLHRQFAGRPEKILALEMGGNNPLVIADVDDLPAAAYWTIQSAFITAGQRCVCARRLILVDRPGHQGFLEELLRQIEGIRAGHYRDDPQPFLGPVVSAAAAESALRQQDHLVSLGGTLLKAMTADAKHPAVLSPGLIDMTDVARRPDEEIFAPCLQLLRVPDLTAAIKEANNTAFGLAAAVFCRDAVDWQRFHREVRAGIINWNRPTTGASSAAPFGGIGRSGNHQPSAYFAADYCAYPIASQEADALRLPDSTSPGLSPPASH